MSFTYIEDKSDEEVYNNMSIGEKIFESNLYSHGGNLVAVAFDSKSRIVAVGDFTELNNAYNKAIIRGCITPTILKGFQVSKEIRYKHNLLLDKSLEKRAKEDLERKMKKSK